MLVGIYLYFCCENLYFCNQLSRVRRTGKDLLRARLIGAGWGGCAVALVKESIVRQFIYQFEGKILPVED
ncbi:hypothetical protein ACOSQ3_009856 [Xanthoceras sorbifolium]